MGWVVKWVGLSVLFLSGCQIYHVQSMFKAHTNVRWWVNNWSWTNKKSKVMNIPKERHFYPFLTICTLCYVCNHAQIMHELDYTWTVHGLYMDYTWIVQCAWLYMDCSQTIHGQCMDKAWTVHELCMDYTWTVHILFVDCAWTVHGLCMNCTWTVYGLYMYLSLGFD